MNTPMFSLEDDTNTVYDRTPLMATIGARLAHFNDRMEYRKLETRLVVSPEEAQERLPGEFVAVEFQTEPTEDETFAIRQELVLSGLYMRAHLDPDVQSIEQAKIILGMLEVHWQPLYDNVISVVDRIQSGLITPITIKKKDELGERETTFFMTVYTVPSGMHDIVLDQINLPLRVKLNEALRNDGIRFTITYSRTEGDWVYSFFEEDTDNPDSILDVDDYNDLIARAVAEPAKLAKSDKLAGRTKLLNDLIGKYVLSLNDLVSGSNSDLTPFHTQAMYDELMANEFTAAANKLREIGGHDGRIANNVAHHLFVQLTLADLTDDKTVIA